MIILDQSVKIHEIQVAMFIFNLVVHLKQHGIWFHKILMCFERDLIWIGIVNFFLECTPNFAYEDEMKTGMMN